MQREEFYEMKPLFRTVFWERGQEGEGDIVLPSSLMGRHLVQEQANLPLYFLPTPSLFLSLSKWEPFPPFLIYVTLPSNGASTF